MLLTEEEAKGKGCHLIPKGVQAGEHNSIAFLQRCAGSNCMAWRWEEKSKRYFNSDTGVYYGVTPQAEWKGYCGLAGKVE